MNILLWTLQILLGLYNITGGLYMISHYEELKSPLMTNFPQAGWVTIGALQALFALGLILPGAFGVMTQLTPVAAIYLTVNALMGCLLYSAYAGFPGILWGVIPALITAFIAYARIAILPL